MKIYDVFISTSVVLAPVPTFASGAATIAVDSLPSSVNGAIHPWSGFNDDLCQSDNSNV
jgi:hypothetical protein